MVSRTCGVYLLGMWNANKWTLQQTEAVIYPVTGSVRNTLSFRCRQNFYTLLDTICDSVVYS